ncbi:WXG100 family type VII secretion target [Saccharopolyspora dendranthemae]|uniref:WXG100 family type VII secretion target n=1 Tax=Saccharopolyspora dendranthemae TaxID=1181886 RepID=A0A561U3V7_9PSEU|nr:WXG100 family type VII secretion target [Saccharopolyspora dendranthemae]TWF94048.1 WXG100 family type VII secretion target [Saccharopolyspora dendranthemae]
MGFEVDPEALRGASPKFDGSADKLASALDKLNGVLQAEGKCWGGDEAGQEFAKQYEPGSQQGTDGMKGLAEALHQVKGELDATARTWDDVDQANADGIKSQG